MKHCLRKFKGTFPRLASGGYTPFTPPPRMKLNLQVDSVHCRNRPGSFHFRTDYRNKIQHAVHQNIAVYTSELRELCSKTTKRVKLKANEYTSKIEHNS
ncbi:hypothetical protein CDAR_404901 [Caerostris darwini]|uniref:Uncharacterized protein n=1 Tax=Caerostris darwini TaxID=1538125 RepID=A0AAV4U6T3_9ARAC|nr:hypothetical protein CDAR_404901 [Caerostris darwini]